MTDRELLVAAAKAAGYEIHHWCRFLPGPMLVDPKTDDCGGYWNPLDDSGDALRLAVTFSMTVAIDCEMKEVAAVFYCGKIARESFKSPNDAQAATRRAIVRCAVMAGELLAAGAPK